MKGLSSHDSAFFAALAIALIAVSAFAVLSIVSSKSEEPYSELYFDIASIASSASPGEVVSFNFFVENHEKEAMQYSYSVLINDVMAKDGLLFLGDNEKKSVEESIALSQDLEKQKVEVQLRNALNEPYNIFFWVDVGAVE